MTSESAYDQVEYPGRPYLQTHPASIAAYARMMNLSPASAERCRVLELGCGDGTNLLGMAAALPGSTFVGVDLVGNAIGAGAELAREAELSNITLHQADFAGLDPGLGSFDYVIAHGVYSWVPPLARTQLLAAMARHLAPDGLAFISYATYPGAHLREIAREMMQFHGRGGGEPMLRVARAVEFVRFVRGTQGASTYGGILEQELSRLGRGDWRYVLHDDFADHHHAVQFHEFASEAAASGLGFATEIPLGPWPSVGFPAAIRKSIESFAEGDAVAREQYVDFVRGTAFRQSLLCHASSTAQAEGHEERLMSLLVRSDLQPQAPRPEIKSRDKVRFVTRLGDTADADEPLIKAIFVTLGNARLMPLPVSEVLARAEPLAGLSPAEGEVLAGRIRAVAGMLLNAASRRLVSIQASPARFATSASERPRASPLVRAQARRGDIVTNLRHEPIQVDSRVHPLVLRADGTHTQAELRTLLAQAKPDGKPHVEPEIFERILQHGIDQALFAS
ncbi:MAG: class I SAM-dependent methyltransferase [Deltaproteobacteria bacterium]